MTSSDTPDATHAPSEPTSETSASAEVVQKPEEKSNFSPMFLEFVEKLKGFKTSEEKIAYGLQFMRETISQEGSPRFREFWESRRVVLPLFKENVNAAVRPKLWTEYVELTVEARRLKEILEEQSSFAIEQIDLAVQAIESEIVRFEELLKDAPSPEFRSVPRILQSKVASYGSIQRELGLYNTLASRLNALRKEIIKTDMRIRFKTKLFRRLSELGDQIFPKRKSLIEQVSSEFQKDVEHFASKHFQGDEVVGAPYYALRDEIKAFQSMAKVLTLSSSVFSRTRTLMSECWDKVKVLEKEHKKVLQDKREASSDAVQSFKEKIETLKSKSAELNLRDLDREIDEIQRGMRAVYLDREDVKDLRASMTAIRSPFVEAEEKKAKELEEAAKEKLRLKKEKINEVKEQIATLIQTGSDLEVDAITQQFQAIESAISELSLSKMEKQLLERQMRPLKDLIADKKEQSLMNLSDDDRKLFENYKLVLDQKKERRQEIKNQIDSYRKMLGASNLDFEKAFQYRELLDQEKERLDKANLAIEEIDRKMSDFEG